jgi:hypothetical protein
MVDSVVRLLNAIVDFLFSWTGFGFLVVLVTVVALVLWRRWRRWNPVMGTSPEAKIAESELSSTRNLPQR